MIWWRNDCQSSICKAENYATAFTVTRIGPSGKFNSHIVLTHFETLLTKLIAVLFLRLFDGRITFPLDFQINAPSSGPSATSPPSCLWQSSYRHLLLHLGLL